MASYNTNLAAEFYVLSMLHRFGADANLTLGNKKSVDIAVILGKGSSITIDFKGIEDKTGCPIDNIGAGNASHFIFLVNFQDKLADPETLLHVWVAPSLKVESLAYFAPGGRKLM